ncbi:MAG: hypothetical protein AAB389_03210 [Patescibacteria group bacterium]
MRSIDDSRKEYLRELSRRSSESRAYEPHQLTGLEIANILEDWEHKSLYIKLAKKHGESEMLRLAKTVAENKEVRNKGAYFMKILKNQNLKKKDDKNSYYSK